MQIAQFNLGAILTFVYLFVQYDIPAIDMHGMPSLDVAHINNTLICWAPVSKIRFEVNILFQSLAEPHVLNRVQLSTVLTKSGSFLGSSNVSDQVGSTISDSFGSSNHDLSHYVRGSRVRCIDTPGEAVYVLVGIAYVIPLIALFSRFFYNAYLKPKTRPSCTTGKTTIADIGQPEAKCIRGASDRSGEIEKK